MPLGYYGTILMALVLNQRYQEYAKNELRRRGLGPYRAAAGPAPESADTGTVPIEAVPNAV
jgi:hypothetical protein